MTEKFPPEYAHIIGIPFKMFKGGETVAPMPPEDMVHIKALPERQAQYEITFPNVTGYRIESGDNDVTFDFSGLENYEIPGDLLPIKTKLASAFSPIEIELEVQSVLEKRDQEIIFKLTKDLINCHFSDDDQNPKFQRFGKLKRAVETWYYTKVILLNITGDVKKKRQGCPCRRPGDAIAGEVKGANIKIKRICQVLNSRNGKNNSLYRWIQPLLWVEIPKVETILLVPKKTSTSHG